MIDRAEKTKVLLENFNKYMMEAAGENLELKSLSKKLYSLFKSKNFITYLSTYEDERNPSVENKKKEVYGRIAGDSNGIAQIHIIDIKGFINCFMLCNFRNILKDVNSYYDNNVIENLRNKFLTNIANEIKKLISSEFETIFSESETRDGKDIVYKIQIRKKAQNRTEKQQQNQQMK